MGSIDLGKNVPSAFPTGRTTLRQVTTYNNCFNPFAAGKCHGRYSASPENGRRMPPDKTATLVAEFKRLLDAENVLSAYSDLMVYECDGYVIEKNCPDVAVFPRNARQVAEIVKICNRHDVPFVPRGAGTSLAG